MSHGPVCIALSGIILYNIMGRMHACTHDASHPQYSVFEEGFEQIADARITFVVVHYTV